MVATIYGPVDKVSRSGDTMTGQLTLPDLAVSGLTGATAASRYVGATASGSPTGGPWSVGDFAIDQTGKVWICTVAGSPGTWVVGAVIDGTTGDIQPSPGTAAAGAVGKAADAGHVHGQPADFAPTGLTGATTASRYVGAVTALPPGSGTFSTGDWVVVLPASGAPYQGVCTAGGSPGTWKATGLQGGTLTAALDPAVSALTGASTVAVNAALGNVFTLTLTASTWTIGAPSNPVDGQVIRIRLTQGTGGSFTVSWATGTGGYDWGSTGGSANSAPTLSTAAGVVDVLGFEYSAALSKWMYLGAPFPQGF